jgi:hypothetical protein
VDGRSCDDAALLWHNQREHGHSCDDAALLLRAPTRR